MANVFTKSNDATPKPNRNTFDGSFVNNLTLKMGQITPCFCKEVIPGDSFRINPTFGFNFQPFVFPVQTDMQANLHFFYVRNRALWKGWMDFITKTENLDGDSTPPYIMLTDENRDMFETGKIGDYLGVPSVYYSKGYVQLQGVYSSYPFGYKNVYGYAAQLWTGTDFAFYMQDDYYSSDATIEALTKTVKNGVHSELGNYGIIPLPWPYDANVPSSAVSPYVKADLPRNTRSFIVASPGMIFNYLNALAPAKIGSASIVIFCVYDKVSEKVISYYARPVSGDSTVYKDRYYNAEKAKESDSNYYRFNLPSVNDCEFYAFITASNNADITAGKMNFEGDLANVFADAQFGIENRERSLIDLPFASTENPDGIRVSALPFRAVEACYNAFYRDERNNPLIIDGKPYYNVYVQDKTGGADTNHYHLYQRNWEADVFTTAVQSPQQGVAPLVGVTASGQMTFQDEEGKSYYLQAEIGEDGHTITGIKSYSSDMPVGTLRAMVDTISTGISINDFRNVNALQRWLETNMRKGLRYKDQIEAHFGTAPTYSELDMPEFIGGMSRRVEVNKVVQTSSDTPDSPLGTLGGNATILGGNGSDISCYADEHGWIIGFITITPKPVYSQQLNKQLTKTQLLDYYFPEFAHIGFQPILNQEIAPLQCTDSEGSRLTDVFGYQRAWYEYLASVDEVHGDFRSTLRDYIINRVFDGVPQLSEDFLTVSTEEANEVFAVQDDSDKIFGQIYFDVKMKRPLPTVGVPRLEVS